jgi:hypothetical protein
MTTPTVADAGSSRRACALEAAQPDGAGGAHLAPEQPGDEEARDHEVHVHADVPTTDTRHVSMKQDNGQHRDGAQALDVGANPVCAGRRACTPSMGLTLWVWRKVTTFVRGRVLRIEGIVTLRQHRMD